MNRDEFFHKLSPRPAKELESIQQAYWLSKHAHRKQSRDGGERYFEHPRRVALRAIAAGFDSTEQIIICLLHDVVEDTDTPLTVIITLFGAQTWERLLLVSKKVPIFDPLTGEVRRRTKKVTKDYFAAISSADIVVRLGKIFDRLDNMSDMRTFTSARRKRYLRETRRYLLPIARLTDLNLHDQLQKLCKEVAQAI